MKYGAIFLTFFFSSAVMPMEQIYQYGIRPVSAYSAEILPGASYLRAQSIGIDQRSDKPGPLHRILLMYGRGIVTKQSTKIFMNGIIGLIRPLSLFKRSISYVPTPVDMMIDCIKKSDNFEQCCAIENTHYAWLIKMFLGHCISFSINCVLMPKIIEYIPVVGRLLDRWQQIHSPYSPNIFDTAWHKPILYLYCGYGALLATEYFFSRRRPKPSN
jgi:hypothetical protein